MEAIAVGVCAALGPDDYITSTHRGHGHCIAKGLDLRLMMAEIIGREDGYCRGRGGSMHITAIDKGMLGADAIVAGSSAIAVGAAHGLRLQGRDGVVVCFFGDGAANQGILHEACNLAAVLVGAGRLRLREQRVGDLDARARPRRGSPTSPTALRATASPASSSTATTFSACAAVDRGGGRSRARRRRPDADRGEELSRHAPLGGDQDRPPARPRSSTPGARATRSCASRATSPRSTASIPRGSRRSRSRHDATSRRRSSSRLPRRGPSRRRRSRTSTRRPTG